MGYRAALIAAALSVISSSCTENTRTQTYELSGGVRDDFSSRPIASARVTFVSDTLYMQSTTTDDDGEYEMLVESDVPLGQVRAEKTGYAAAEASVFFDTVARRVELRLRPE
jgi:hypothetical protein